MYNLWYCILWRDAVYRSFVCNERVGTIKKNTCDSWMDVYVCVCVSPIGCVHLLHFHSVYHWRQIELSCLFKTMHTAQTDIELLGHIALPPAVTKRYLNTHRRNLCVRGNACFSLYSLACHLYIGLRRSNTHTHTRALKCLSTRTDIIKFLKRH